MSGVRFLPLLLLLSPQSAQAQRIREFQFQGVATFAAARFVGGGIGLGIRPPGRLGFLLSASGGDLEGVVAGRAEALTVFRLSPYATKGVIPYSAAGLAVLARKARGDGYLTMVLGLESRPGAKSGWFLEAGFGGGVRVSAGVRIRRITPARARR